jgi:hypothetical protein
MCSSASTISLTPPPHKDETRGLPFALIGVNCFDDANMDDFDDNDVDNDQSLDDFINREDGVIEDEEEFDDGGFNFGDDAHTEF